MTHDSYCWLGALPILSVSKTIDPSYKSYGATRPYKHGTEYLLFSWQIHIQTKITLQSSWASLMKMIYNLMQKLLGMLMSAQNVRSRLKKKMKFFHDCDFHDFKVFV